MPKLLFLCTGNYYRSRFAEILFNHLAPTAGLDRRAESRGLELHPANPGPISAHTVRALDVLGISPGELRMPMPVTAADFAAADYVVAVKEAEHRALMNQYFPHLADSIDYWHVHDLDCSGPEETIAHLRQEVSGLMQRLSSTS